MNHLLRNTTVDQETCQAKDPMLGIEVMWKTQTFGFKRSLT